MCGWYPTFKDAELYDTLRIVVFNDELAKWPHLNRWHINMKSFTQEERLTFPAVEVYTSLAETIERLKNTCYVSKSMLDQKVRQPVACKQSCHKLLCNCCDKHTEDFPSRNTLKLLYDKN